MKSQYTLSRIIVVNSLQVPHMQLMIPQAQVAIRIPVEVVAQLCVVVMSRRVIKDLNVKIRARLLQSMHGIADMVPSQLQGQAMSGQARSRLTQSPLARAEACWAARSFS